MTFKLPSRFDDPWELELPSRKWGALHKGLSIPLSSLDQPGIPVWKLLSPGRPPAERTDPSGVPLTPGTGHHPIVRGPKQRDPAAAAYRSSRTWLTGCGFCQRGGSAVRTRALDSRGHLGFMALGCPVAAARGLDCWPHFPTGQSEGLGMPSAQLPLLGAAASPPPHPCSLQGHMFSNHLSREFSQSPPGF